MDDLGDPCWSWPHWKFGLKRDDLFTKLHDQYNTVSSAIQDPEAFHHDVYEISNAATSAEDFHRRLHVRKEQRLRELNDSLESAAFEIIANPSLIGTEQWQYAVQLFRTKSFDSIVRYFASYLPQGHKWRPAGSSSVSETSTDVSVASSHGSSFFGVEEGPIMTDEPLELSESFKGLLPASPRSMTMYSQSSSSARDDQTPSRTLSFSESEPECPPLEEDFDYYDEDCSQPCEADLPEDFPSNFHSNVDGDASDEAVKSFHDGAPQADPTCLATPTDSLESETPTPKPERHNTSFFEAKPSLPQRRHRSISPSRPVPLSRREVAMHLAQSDPRHSTLSTQPLRPGMVGCKAAAAVRRSRKIPGQVAMRIRKLAPSSMRLRPRARKV